eukprot:s3065_g9.t1
MSEPEPLTPQGLLRWIVCSLYLDEAIPRGSMIQWYWQLLTGVILIESTPGVYMDPPGSKKLNFRAVLEEPPLSWRGFVQEEDHSIQELVRDEVWEEIKSHLLRGEISFGRLLQIITICTHQDKYLGVRDGQSETLEVQELQLSTRA